MPAILARKTVVLPFAGALSATACALLAVVCGGGGGSQQHAATPTTPTAGGAGCPTVAVAPPSHPLKVTHVSPPGAVFPVSTPHGAAMVRDGRLVGAGLDVQLKPDELQGGVAVDDQRGVYVIDALAIVKLDAKGQEVWRRTPAQVPHSVFVMGSDAATRVGATYRDSPASQLWTTGGKPAGNSGVHGDFFAPTRSGGLVATDQGKYVRVFDAMGRETETIGFSGKDNDPSPPGAPLQFYQLGGAAQLDDGRLLIGDTQHGLMVVSADGVLEGMLAPTQIDPIGVTERAGPVLHGKSVYVATGQRFSTTQRLSKISVADVLARATHGETGTDPRLGFGAGMVVSPPQGYAPAGTPVRVNAAFDASWGRMAKDVQLCYTIRNADQLRQRQSARPVTTSIQPFVGVRGGRPLDIGRDLAPGAYQIDASLVRGGRALSRTSLGFTVGAKGQTLDFAKLPPGADAGGPAPPRGVALASVFGTGAHRVQLDWNQLLPKGGTEPDIDVSAYAKPLAAAAALAKQRGVTLDVQVGQGNPVEKKLVANGTWEHRVEQVVSKLKGSVHVWEAWNEPNSSFGPARSYVKKVLAPFYRAVKRADPTATVVGGSTLGPALPYWRRLIAAGGLKGLDVAGVHPYTGVNRSWEENGTIPQLTELRKLLVKGGKPIPTWVTELSWASDGPFNFLAQADNSSRAMLWMKALGIAKWAYFVPEGSFGAFNQSFSAIQTQGYVKPSALALMTTSAQLRGRKYLGQADVGAPSAYAMHFGPRAGDAASGDLLVAWTDGLKLPAALTAKGGAKEVVRTDELGASGPVKVGDGVPVTLDSAPQFFAVHGKGRLSVTAREPFGTDVATAAAGAKATATSQLPTNPATAAIDGDAGADGKGDILELPMWASGKGDAHPVLTVALAAPTQLDRILVATHSNGGTVTSLRDYDIQTQSAANAPWATIRTVHGQFTDRQLLAQFPARTVTAIRVRVRGLNFSGFAGGPKPSFWPAGNDGNAVVAELRAYAPRSRRALGRSGGRSSSGRRATPERR